MTRKRPVRAVQRAVVETFFMIAMKRGLPPQALEELRKQRREDAVAWAKRWNLNAPCVIKEAQELAGIDDTGDTHIDRVVTENDSAAWVKELGRLDALPRSISRQALNDKLAAHRVSDYRKHHLVNDEDVLAPLSANPVHETQDDFVRRARDHYEARFKILERGRFVVAKPRSSPEIERHVEWLLEFQVGKKSYADIARAAGLDHADAPASVRMAVKRIAAVIGLELRTGTRGRPRHPRK